ncbi:MAG: hypothetical protein BWY82_02502 [Verrucomicrobia bacterium ADurb.Bin474]|nr:MAG: hypothetical protein BWY82_02502 [Verrucomicrobia bacterium ADurb.Bin474]
MTSPDIERCCKPRIGFAKHLDPIIARCQCAIEHENALILQRMNSFCCRHEKIGIFLGIGFSRPLRRQIGLVPYFDIQGVKIGARQAVNN